MQYKALPKEISELLEKLDAPPRLVAHLTLVHDVACELTSRLKISFPHLEFDREAVLFGAASHDIGKIFCRAELTQSGCEHEEKGLELLLKEGFSARLSRFALTHGGPKREPNPTLEDLLVQEADAIWKGGRFKALENALIQSIKDQTGLDEWEVFSKLDDILTEIADSSDERLAWQAMHKA